MPQHLVAPRLRPFPYPPRERSFAVFIARELAIWGVLYAVYFVVRGHTIAGFADAAANARRIVHVERLTSLDHERLVQQLASGGDLFQQAVARYYELGFFPTIVVGLLWLASRDRDRYRELRNTMLLAIGAAMVVFLLLPTAPPRLVPDLGIADTVGMNSHDTGSVYGVSYNPYAAMPSMHVGWSILLATGLYHAARHRVTQALAVAHPVLMTFAVLATGNHYVLDAVVGAAIALVARAVVRAQAEPPLHAELAWVQGGWRDCTAGRGYGH